MVSLWRYGLLVEIRPQKVSNSMYSLTNRAEYSNPYLFSFAIGLFIVGLCYQVYEIGPPLGDTASDTLYRLESFKVGPGVVDEKPPP